jgi:NADH:ubiquinone oxidoreductase subunit 5 (subunit L)/multisubunit Na+/H+ antiporter MnhA subunit
MGSTPINYHVTIFYNHINMLLLTIILPLLGTICAGLFGRFIGRVGAAFITTIIMFINVILTVILFYKTSVLQKIYFTKLGP